MLAMLSLVLAHSKYFLIRVVMWVVISSTLASFSRILFGAVLEMFTQDRIAFLWMMFNSFLSLLSVLRRSGAAYEG